MTGDGVLLAEGVDWRRQRRMLAPVFTPANVALMLPHFQAAADELVSQLQGVNTANLARALHTSTLDAVLRALFSRSAQEGASSFAQMARRYGRGPGPPQPVGCLRQVRGRLRLVHSRAATLPG